MASLLKLTILRSDIMLRYRTTRFLILVCFLFFSASLKAYSISRISGSVTDIKNEPIPGATVAFLCNDSLVTGTSTDDFGNFKLKYNFKKPSSFHLVVSCIGYRTLTKEITVNGKETNFNCNLEFSEIELPSIQVTPSRNFSFGKQTFNTEVIDRQAHHSLIPTNPINSIKDPQVSKAGSVHSSKLRVNGTNPKYYINGVNIGTDPNHYGVFSIIPSSMVEKINFYAQRTGAEYDLPSVIGLETPVRFEKHHEGDINLSVVEATGSYSIGGGNYFMVGSLRKSVLDKLVNRFDIDSDRQTIPPTNFQDIYLSSGLKLSSRYHLYFDQFHVQDYLAYNTDPSDYNPRGIQTNLHSDEHYFGTRLNAAYDRFLFEIGAAIRYDREEYMADVISSWKTNDYYVNLSEDQRLNSFNFKADYYSENTTVTFGGQAEYKSHDETSLEQSGWNFLPADAVSDNTYLYQRELNILYGEYEDDISELNGATFASLTHRFKNIEIKSGLRAQYFENLSVHNTLSFREDLTLKTGRGVFEFYFGTFSENPANNILEPYQILIRDNLENLEPIETRLVSANYNRGVFKIGLFAKRIDNLPVITNDFSKINSNGEVYDGFISMVSNGRGDFYGSSVSLDLPHLFSDRLHLYTFYSYTHSCKIDQNVSTPYDMDSPHRFFIQGYYRLSKHITVGCDWSIRSGYPYTSSRPYYSNVDENRYTEEYYNDALSMENSERFPVNSSFNLYLDCSLGSADIFLSVTNVTNRANPIINTTDGFIYDAGILPSIGVKWRF